MSRDEDEETLPEENNTPKQLPEQQLINLKKLLERKYITPEEYEMRKKALLHSL